MQWMTHIKCIRLILGEHLRHNRYSVKIGFCRITLKSKKYNMHLIDF